MEKRRNFYLVLILLGCIWGSTFLFIRIGVRDIKPMTFTSLRLFIATLVFYIVLKLSGKDLRISKELIPLLILTGIVDASIPHFLIAWGEQYVESGVASLILATSPFFTLIGNYFNSETFRENGLFKSHLLLPVIWFCLLFSICFCPGVSQHFKINYERRFFCSLCCNCRFCTWL